MTSFVEALQAHDEVTSVETCSAIREQNMAQKPDIFCLAMHTAMGGVFKKMERKLFLMPTLIAQWEEIQTRTHGLAPRQT